MKYILSPEEYKLPNPRIDGWKKLREVKARTVDVWVFSLEVFDYFLKYNELPEEFLKELEDKAGEIIKNSPSHTVIIRRAFVVPGLENPPGPRFLGLSTVDAATKAIKKLYQFVIAHKYHESKDSQISGWLEFPSITVDPKSSLDFSSIPYGGYAACQNDIVEIYAVFGINEGVQSLVADRYLVENRQGRIFISRKEVPQKNLMLCTTTNAEKKTLPVPIDLQFEQVLSDGEILEMARVVFELSKKYGPQRIEFSTTATNSERFLSPNEVSDYWREVKTGEGIIQVQGRVLIVNSVEDLEKISTIDSVKLKSGEYIIFVGKDIIADRNYDVLGALAARKDNLFVLYPGVAATQHAMRILADKGHKAFLVGNQKYDEGDEVQITTAGGKIRVTNLSRTESQEIVSLWDASLFGNEICGGKANRLSLMKIAGFQVPHGLVISTVVFDEIVKNLGFESPVKIDDFSKLEIALDNPPAKIVKQISELLSDYGRSGKFFAVRSSATIEDNIRQSLAGMFETFLNVSDGDLAKKVFEVLKSSFVKKVAEYLENDPGLVSQLKMAVTVQEMVPARAAGVIFGADIRGRNADIVEIEANQGLGEGIVSGEAKEIEQIKFSRSEKRVLTQKGPEILSQAEKKALFMLSERLRKEFNDIPQDIEWAIDKEGQIWVLQSRDLIY